MSAMEGEAKKKDKITFACKFCNVILATEMGNKETFVNHMEEIHTILLNLKVVMAIHFLTEEEEENLTKKKRGQLNDLFGINIELGQDDTVEEDKGEENLKIPMTFVMASSSSKVTQTQTNFLEPNKQDEKCKLGDPKRRGIIQMFPCKYCRKSFKDDQGLKRHIKLVHKEAPIIPTANKGTFLCMQCLKTFAKEKYLKIHMRRCGDESKLFPCNACDASFAMNADLKQHKSRHTRQSVFSCQHCEKTFRTRDGLKYHQEIHIREHREHRDQVFPCEECKESFSRTIYLGKVFETNRALIILS